MLHKKTEYRLQYGKLNEDLRRKIWQDNITLRKSRLLSNQATHYWEYQMRDDVCDCANEDEEDSDREPLPPLRRKHKALQDQHSLQPATVLSDVRDAREIAVQTPEWTGDEPGSRLGNASEEEVQRNLSSVTLSEPKVSHRRTLNEPSTSRSRPRTAVSVPRPTRTSRKLRTETKQTHFVPFGWNERRTDVGHKQTYNVSAPLKEVHDSAVMASQRRKAETQMFLAQEKQVKHQTRPRERTCSSSSSTWMSEYQEQFSQRGARPVSAPPAPRQSVAWRRS